MWWFDDAAAPGWHDWLGLLLTVAGFLIAFRQLRKTQTAAETAASELARARLKLNSDQLAAVLPQLTSIVSDLDFAIDNNDREVAHRALLRFSYVAKEAIALLANLDADHTSLQSRLGGASSTALDVKGSIVGKKSVDIARSAKAIGADINGLSVEISGLVAQDRYLLGGGEDVR